MNTIIIPTTQNIELEYPVAGLGDRFVAAMVDVIIMLAYYVIWYAILTEFVAQDFFDKAMSGDEADQNLQTIGILVMLPLMCYSAICEIFFNGQTLGKKLAKIRSIRLDGSAPTISQYLLRWTLRIVDVWLTSFLLLPGLIGVITMAVNKKGQRLGDLVAGTTVIKLELVTSFMDTIFVDTEENYEPKFPEITKLRDRDVSILKEVLDIGVKSQNPKLLRKLSTKVQEVAGISTKMPPQQFLEIVMQDYNHYYGRD